MSDNLTRYRERTYPPPYPDGMADNLRERNGRDR